MRFIVMERSESGHCCFVASVLDTDSPELDGDGAPMNCCGHSGEEPCFEIVCECFDVGSAYQIAALLNEEEPKP